MGLRTREEMDTIRNFMKEQGFSNMAEFGRIVGMSRQNIYERVKGSCNPDIRTMLKWAGIIPCNVMELIKLFYTEEYREYMEGGNSMKREWTIVEECNDDNGNPTVWSTEINHDKYGKYCWITRFTGNVYKVEIELLHGDFTTLKECKTLASAKAWVTRNL